MRDVPLGSFHSRTPIERAHIASAFNATLRPR